MTSNLNQQINFAQEKANYCLVKKMIMGFMGGFFIGMTYLVYTIIASHMKDINLEILGVFIGALIFPIGIFMCMFIGGNLVTSNVLIYMGVYKKKIKVKNFILDIFVTLIFNILGIVTIATIVFLIGFYTQASKKYGWDYYNKINSVGEYVIQFTKKKINHSPWSTFLSAILCNFCVAGSIFAYLNLSKNKGIGIVVVYLLIVIFVIGGFQHVVANSYIIFESMLLTIVDQTKGLNEHDFFQIFVINFPFTILGNILSGIMIAYIYLISDSAKAKLAQKK